LELELFNIKKFGFLALVISLLSGCSGGPLSAEQLAARETESDWSLWDEEDYKTRAAQACLKFKVVFNNALGDWYGDWTRLTIEYTRVDATASALEDHPKWDPIAKTVFQHKVNAINRSVGNPGTEVSSAVALQAFNLCKELGVDLSN
jgi:hypothetical protein